MNDGFSVIQGTQSVGVGEDLNGFAEPIQLAGGHDIGHMLTVGDHRDGFATLSPAYSILPRGCMLAGHVEVIS